MRCIGGAVCGGDDVTIWIPGIPKTAQTGNIIRLKDGRTFKKRANSEWFAYVRLAMSQAKWQGESVSPLSGPLAAAIQFIMPDLASSKRAYPVKRPDMDNLLKGLLDCGNGIIWNDDAQIVDLKLEKRYARNTDQQAPGVLITVWEK
jgi:Holliday junction resolvase RusA-like endonuclease